MPTTPSTAKRQHDFAAALLDPAQPLPEGLVGPDGRPSLKRFNVYRNNVVAGLTATLKDAFPAVARIVGEEFFLAMISSRSLHKDAAKRTSWQRVPHKKQDAKIFLGTARQGRKHGLQASPQTPRKEKQTH